MKRHVGPAVILSLTVLLAGGLAGCLAAPEQCAGCLALSDRDGGAQVDEGGGGGYRAPGSSGGIAGPAGSGGLMVSGGTGGFVATGGAAGTGGPATGGLPGAGGAATGGQAVIGTGGRGTAGTAGTGGTGGTGTGTGGSVGTGGRGTGGQGTGGQGTDSDLVLWYKFDESSGSTAADSAPASPSPSNGRLVTYGSSASATFSSTSHVGTHAVSLSAGLSPYYANGGYVTATTLQTLAPAAITIAVWVNLPVNTSAQKFERILDFGSGIGVKAGMYLTARAEDAGGTPVRFAISTVGYGRAGEQRIDGSSALSTNTWHHVAVVLPAGSPFTGSLYVDGSVVGTNPNMTLHAVDLGATSNNWLGRSQYSNTSGTDSYFTGYLDDFRVYRRALSPAEIAMLMTVR